MNKKIFALIVFPLFLSACNTVPDPWEGVPRDSVNAWQSIGVAPIEAKEYVMNGFTPTDTKPWLQMGFKKTDETLKWHRAGFSPEQASKFIKEGYTLEKALEIRKLVQ